MELVSAKIKRINTEVIEVRNSSQIESALLELLSVPDERLKPKIVSEIVSYFDGKFSNPESKTKFFVASQNNKITGFVSCQIDGEYKSYGMPCPTFGWLHAQDLETCEALMVESERFVHENKKKNYTYKIYIVVDVLILN